MATNYLLVKFMGEPVIRLNLGRKKSRLQKGKKVEGEKGEKVRGKQATGRVNGLVGKGKGCRLQ